MVQATGPQTEHQEKWNQRRGRQRRDGEARWKNACVGQNGAKHGAPAQGPGPRGRDGPPKRRETKKKRAKATARAATPEKRKRTGKGGPRQRRPTAKARAAPAGVRVNFLKLTPRLQHVADIEPVAETNKCAVAGSCQLNYFGYLDIST
ncbi:hypothetical protein GOBAR_DD13451 [Gossypium barbadense]|nr:hypothetical protein GOBAR_DD13451 [Gossypium barbadense]